MKTYGDFSYGSFLHNSDIQKGRSAYGGEIMESGGCRGDHVIGDGARFGAGEGDAAVTEWKAVNTYEDDAIETGGTYESTGDEENAIHVSGGSVIFNQPTITGNSSTAQGGDSEVGVGQFYMIDGSLTSHNGGLFYTTNTESNFYLQNVTITPADNNMYFLRVSGNGNQRGWGESGANGADTNFTAVQQNMEGDILYDSISNLDFYMQEGSLLTGGILDDETYALNGGDGRTAVYVDASSRWIVTKDSTVTDLYNAGTIVDAAGKTVSIVGANGTVYVQGESDYSVTVNGTYRTTADFSKALTADSWDTYAVSRPAVLTASASASPTPAPSTQAAETPASGTPVSIYVLSVVALAAVLVIIGFVRKRKK